MHRDEHGGRPDRRPAARPAAAGAGPPPASARAAAARARGRRAGRRRRRPAGRTRTARSRLWVTFRWSDSGRKSGTSGMRLPMTSADSTPSRPSGRRSGMAAIGCAIVSGTSGALLTGGSAVGDADGVDAPRSSHQQRTASSARASGRFGLKRARRDVRRVVQVGALVEGAQRRRARRPARVADAVHRGRRRARSGRVRRARAAGGTGRRPPSTGSSARRTRRLRPSASRRASTHAPDSQSTTTARRRPRARSRPRRCAAPPAATAAAGAARRCGRRGR